MSDSNIQMTSNKPYLVRAFYQWIVDNQLTPYLMVNATMPGVKVPPHAVQEGQVILNINPSAVSSLIMDNDVVSFSARFNGVAEHLYIPSEAVMAIYARENGQGMMFSEFEPYEVDDTLEESDASEDDSPDDEPPKPPFLKVVK